MAQDEKPKQVAVEGPARNLEEFLESSPPGTDDEVVAGWKSVATGSGVEYILQRPDVRLYCDDDDCQGLRFFHSTDSDLYFREKVSRNVFLTYSCRNCCVTTKTYAVMLWRVNANRAHIFKFGEDPPFGPPTPARLISLIGPDREIFLQGRRAENHGLGIGAFAYYRRVVENQKARIIREIIKASQKLGASAETLKELELAENETQFSKAIEQVKAGIPSALRIDGHNPLSLLHTALSEGIHGQTDDECLQIAQEIRVVLGDLAERISQALKEESEVKEAVSRLLNRKKKEG